MQTITTQPHVLHAERLRCGPSAFSGATGWQHLADSHWPFHREAALDPPRDAGARLEYVAHGLARQTHQPAEKSVV